MDVNWWNEVTEFHQLVIHNNSKWEFVAYQPDPSKQVDWILIFTPVPSYDPNYQATTYVDVDKILHNLGGNGCECGASFSSFGWDHMRFCKLWKPWDKL